jgi:flagellar basal-body rod protein FlgC
MDLNQSMAVSFGGMMAQTARAKTAAENIANADSALGADGKGPYREKQVYFKSVLNRRTGMTEVKLAKTSPDMVTPLQTKYEPGNSLADAKGFVQYPNVDPTIENINMREAQRSYQANLSAIGVARDMANRTLDMLR